MLEMTLNPGQSIQDSLNLIPNDTPAKVHLAPGNYVENLRINNNNISLVGSLSEQSVITYDDHAGKIHRDGREYNTFRTPTVTVMGNDVSLEQLTIRNSAGYSPEIQQAVVLAIYGDNTKIANCRLEGYQDTLFLGPLPIDLTERYKGFLPDEELHSENRHHHFLHCTIQGNVDFIFGSSTALFEECDIIALMPGYIVAPSTYASNPVGFVFSKSRIINKSDSDRVYLARPWREHGFVCFDNCLFQGNFMPERYHDWNKTHYRFYENPYVKTPMSRRLDKERRKQLLSILGDLFPVDPRNQKPR